MEPMEIDPKDEINQQRKAEHEARHDDEPGVVGTVDDAVGSILRPFAPDQPDDDEAERQRLLNDAEQR